MRRLMFAILFLLLSHTLLAQPALVQTFPGCGVSGKSSQSSLSCPIGQIVTAGDTLFVGVMGPYNVEVLASQSGGDNLGPGVLVDEVTNYVRQGKGSRINAEVQFLKFPVIASGYLGTLTLKFSQNTSGVAVAVAEFSSVPAQAPFAQYYNYTGGYSNGLAVFAHVTSMNTGDIVIGVCGSAPGAQAVSPYTDQYSTPAETDTVGPVYQNSSYSVALAWLVADQNVSQFTAACVTSGYGWGVGALFGTGTVN